MGFPKYNLPAEQSWQIVASVLEESIGDFDEVSGGDVQQNVVSQWQGGSQAPQPVQSTYSISELTLTRNFIPSRDLALLDYINRAKIGAAEPLTVVKKYFNLQGIFVGSETYVGCIFKDSKSPDGKAGDDTISHISVILVPTDKF